MPAGVWPAALGGSGRRGTSGAGLFEKPGTVRTRVSGRAEKRRPDTSERQERDGRFR